MLKVDVGRLRGKKWEMKHEEFAPLLGHAYSEYLCFGYVKRAVRGACPL
jgi:hypothetical protein